MKTRNGFVSNSSSSSFIAIGWKLETNEEIVDVIKAKHPEWVEGKADLEWHTLMGMVKDIGEPLIHLDGVILGKLIGTSVQNGTIDDINAEITSEVVKEVERIGKEAGFRRPRIIVGEFDS